jgi:hypothetical protein
MKKIFQKSKKCSVLGVSYPEFWIQPFLILDSASRESESELESRFNFFESKMQMQMQIQ